MALETNVEAYLPVGLSLAKLYIRSAWYTLTGGKEKSLTLFDAQDSEDGWYFGRAKSEFKRRLTPGRAELESSGEGGDGLDDDGTYTDVSRVVVACNDAVEHFCRTTMQCSGPETANAKKPSGRKQSMTTTEDLAPKIISMPQFRVQVDGTVTSTGMTI